MLTTIDDQSQSQSQQQKGNRLFLLLIGLAFIILILNKAFFWSGHPLLTYPDQSAYFAMAEMITQGKLPYVDFFEWNPPLIMYLNLIPVFISRLFHLPGPLAINFSVLGLSAASSFLSLWIAYKYLSKQDFVAILPMLFAVAYFSQDLLVNTGEREHLFVLSYLPYFVLRSIVWQSEVGNPKAISKFDAVLCGLLAGVGLALKPQFVASAFIVELFFYCQFKTIRSFVRPEIYSLISVFIVYLVLCLFLPPAVWDVYFHQVVPLYLSGLSYSSETLLLMLRTNSDFYLPFLHLILTLSAAIALSRYSPLIAPLAAFSLSFLFHYIYGAQSWPYRFLPMSAGLFMLDGLIFSIVLSLVLTRLRLQQLTRPVLAGAMLCLAGSLTYQVINIERDCRKGAGLFDMRPLGYEGKCLKSDLDPLFFFIVDKTKPTDGAFFMGTGIGPGYPAILQSGRQQGSRYIFCLLPFLDYCLNETHAKRWQEMTELVIANYGKDIAERKPAMIMVQKRVVLDLLVQQNFFVRFMGDYEISGETDMHEIWVRMKK
ncbi:hypothetical protein KBI23_11975 [bacterium]|nr:hypothetical protein [bacterium]MBP9808640.1 hypothetical protein [bacterium]